jgi:hypothetical protein
LELSSRVARDQVLYAFDNLGEIL